MKKTKKKNIISSYYCQVWWGQSVSPRCYQVQEVQVGENENRKNSTHLFFNLSLTKKRLYSFPLKWSTCNDYVMDAHEEIWKDCVMTDLLRLVRLVHLNVHLDVASSLMPERTSSSHPKPPTRGFWNAKYLHWLGGILLAPRWFSMA